MNNAAIWPNLIRQTSYSTRVQGYQLTMTVLLKIATLLSLITESSAGRTKTGFISARRRDLLESLWADHFVHAPARSIALRNKRARSGRLTEIVSTTQRAAALRQR